MMLKRSIVSQTIALALLMPGIALADLPQIEATGYIKNETSVYTQSGQTIGAEKTSIDTSDSVSAGEVLKFENSVRAFKSYGSTAPNRVKEQLRRWQAELDQ